MKRLAGLISYWWPPLVVAVVCASAQGLGWGEALRYEQALIGAEPWRLLSGHLVHLGWMHLGLNLAGLALIWALVGHALRSWAWGVAFALSALTVGGGLYLHDTGLAWYVGLSGVLHGLLVFGAVAGLHTERRMALTLLVGVAAKLAWEQLSGGDVGTAELVGGAVIVNAHLYGALGGLAAVPLLLLRGRR
jgi:rhomboid family GlyGly-CTERM serine protease